VEKDGGYARAMASGAIQNALALSRAAREKAAASRRLVLVGVNNYPDLTAKEAPAESPPPEPSPFPPSRLAEPFEAIRRRTERHARRAGRRPKVLLLQHGDVRMRMARANFSLNLFGCAGFEIEQSESHAGTDADLVVLCSSDPEYLALAREVCPEVAAPVIVAGHPKEHVEALTAAGVQGFIYAGMDAVQTLTGWQDRLGIGTS
jgi:methylmalonyl-CoA mutase